jgi:YVTN family beta-propeller protein
VAAALTLLAACGPASTPTATPAPAKPAEAPQPAGGAPVAPASAPAAAPRPTEAAKPAEPTGPSAAPTTAASPTAGAAARPAAAPAGETVYVFNVGSKDVTLVDAAARQVRETRPLGAQVRWLSNEQPYSDGQLVWTYDFPDNKLQAIAIDPGRVEVVRRIEGIGAGPGHSLVVLPDKKKAALNVAGDNLIAFLDLPSGKVEATMKTGAFP